MSKSSALPVLATLVTLLVLELSLASLARANTVNNSSPQVDQTKNSDARSVPNVLAPIPPDTKSSDGTEPGAAPVVSPYARLKNQRAQQRQSVQSPAFSTTLHRRHGTTGRGRPH